MVLQPRYMFEVYKKISDGVFNVTPVVVTGFTDISFRGGIESTKDVITVKFPNEKNDNVSYNRFLGKKQKFDNIFSVDDEIKIYGYYSRLPADKDQALIMTGRISGFGYDTDTNKMGYNLKIINRTEELLNTMTPFSTRAEQGATNTAPTAIKQMVRRLNQFHGNDPRRQISAYLTTEINPITGSFGKIQATKSDGTAFPTIDYNETWKPIIYNVEKLSDPAYTGDDNAGTYITYITYTPVSVPYQSVYGTSTNEIAWKSKTLIAAGSLTEGRDIVRCKISLDLKDIQNILIVNAGTDRQGAGITGVAYNLNSIGKFGAKVGYYTKSRRLYSNIWGQEVAFGSALGKQFDVDGMPSATTGSNAYPLSMSFSERDTFSGSFTGSTLVARNKKEWNQYLRDESRWQAVVEAQKILEKLGVPRYNLTADQLIGSNTIIPGNLYNFIVPSYGWQGNTDNPGYKLRVTTMSHSWNKEGWSTQIEAAEDEKVISDILGNSKSNVA